jgi:hypothetical protein
MNDVTFRVAWKGKKSELVVSEEGEELKGYVGDTHVLTLVLDEDDVLVEEFCHDNLVYDEDALTEAIEAALDEEEDEEDDEESDEEDDEESDEEDDEESDEDDEEDDEESDEEDEESDEEDDEESDEAEVDEDEDADYGEPVEPANIDGVPTLHALLVAYGAGIDVDGDVRIARNFFRKLQKLRIVNVQETLLTGAEATGKNTLAALKGISADSNDVVWFMYSGHGGMEEGERYLVTHGKLLRRGAVSEAIAALGARLSIVLSDCCANEMGRLDPGEKMGAAGPGESANPKLQGLFTRFGGTFDVSSSSDFQYSFGGVFTPALIDKVLSRHTPETWEQVFEETQKIALSTTEGAMTPEGRRALKKAGLEVEDAQKPVAFSLPTEVLAASPRGLCDARRLHRAARVVLLGARCSANGVDSAVKRVDERAARVARHGRGLDAAFGAYAEAQAAVCAEGVDEAVHRARVNRAVEADGRRPAEGVLRGERPAVGAVGELVSDELVALGREDEVARERDHADALRLDGPDRLAVFVEAREPARVALEDDASVAREERFAPHAGGSIELRGELAGRSEQEQAFRRADRDPPVRRHGDGAGVCPLAFEDPQRLTLVVERDQGAVAGEHVGAPLGTDHRGLTGAAGDLVRPTLLSIGAERLHGVAAERQQERAIGAHGGRRIVT